MELTERDDPQRERTMGRRQVQVMTTKRTSQRRDDDLRAAHKEAFDRILEARATPGYQDTVHQAVTELIEACENYVARH
jgi:predicted metal-dependent peptidase